MSRVAKGLLAMAAAVTLAACEAPPPHIQDIAAFDRNNPQFGKERTASKEVTVCYAKDGTTPASVGRIAADECGRFGLQAAFVKQTYFECPLMTPVAAHYVCRQPQAEKPKPAASRGLGPAGSGDPPGDPPGGPYGWSYRPPSGEPGGR